MQIIAKSREENRNLFSLALNGALVSDGGFMVIRAMDGCLGWSKSNEIGKSISPLTKKN